MKNKILITLIFLSNFLLTACGAKTAAPKVESPAPVSTVKPDPCSESALPGEVTRVNDLMREFDDYSKLASSTPQDQLVQVIPPMQEIRRRAQSQEIPDCLSGLKSLQVKHMDAVIEVLLAFMGGAQPENVNQGIAQARELHLQYDVEMARLLGITLVPSPTSAAVVDPESTAPPSGPFVFNPGPDAVTLLSTPDSKAGGVATLAAGLTTTAFGQTADGLWIQVEVPGQPSQKAWVSSKFVQVSGQLPEVTP